MIRLMFILLITAIIAGGCIGRGSGENDERAALAEPDFNAKLEKATFAGGCFWCMEPPFDKLDGVVSTTSGYTGGHAKDPTYQEVSAGGTGHAEAVQVRYDPRKISYAQLLDVFWHNVDPLTSDRQFCDQGHQYRTAIFYHDEKQRRLAVQSKEALEASSWRKMIAAKMLGISYGRLVRLMDTHMIKASAQ